MLANWIQDTDVSMVGESLVANFRNRSTNRLFTTFNSWRSTCPPMKGRGIAFIASF